LFLLKRLNFQGFDKKSEVVEMILMEYCALYSYKKTVLFRYPDYHSDQPDFVVFRNNMIDGSYPVGFGQLEVMLHSHSGITVYNLQPWKLRKILESFLLKKLNFPDRKLFTVINSGPRGHSLAVLRLDKKTENILRVAVQHHLKLVTG